MANKTARKRAAREQAEQQAALEQALAPQIGFVAEGFAVAAFQEPPFKAPMLAMQMLMRGGGRVVATLPAAYWETLKESGDKAIADFEQSDDGARSRAEASGIVLPEGVDVDTMAQMAAEAERELRGEGGPPPEANVKPKE